MRLGYNEPGMMKMMMVKSRRLANGDHRARGRELTGVSTAPEVRGRAYGGATTAPEAQYDTL